MSSNCLRSATFDLLGLSNLARAGAACLLLMLGIPGSARPQGTSLAAATQPGAQDARTAPAPEQNALPNPPWQYGAFVDLGYLLDFNHPANDLFRERGTTPRVDEVDLNMAGLYIRKDSAKLSPWGAEFELQAGEDAKEFGFSATAPNLRGANILRHFGRANVSYFIPAGKGLTVQAGIFNSLIGYDSLYAKDNFSYTRPWGGDYTPYLMMGVNAVYPFSDKLTGAVFVVNGYWHLADANSVPSSGGQLAYKATSHWTLKQTVFTGPHQSDTAFEFWRFFSDSIAEWKRGGFTIPFEYQAGTEKLAVPGNPRALWMSSQLPAHWTLSNRWSISLRPEIAWDRNGRWTGTPQTIKALTSTLEYRVPYRQTITILRLEHRYDDSHGRGAGFFRGAELSPGIVALTPTQNLLVFAVIFSFDGQFRH